MKAIAGLIVRWIANLWSVLSIGFIFLWVVVQISPSLVDSKWILLGYLPPFWFCLFIVPPVLVFFFQRLHKRIFLLLALYLIVFFGFGDLSFHKTPSHQFTDGERTQPLTVVALNLRYYSFGFNEIVHALNQMDADLYLLSENDITAKQIEAMKKAVAPKQFHMGQQESTAIISRYPLISFKEVKFPTRQASLHKGNKLEKMHLNPYRSFVHAVVDVNGTPVHAISVRFIAGRPRHRTLDTTIEWTFYVLEAQKKEIAFFLDYLKKLEGPVIFGGDLNATPGSFVIRKLNAVAVDLYLQDHWFGGFTFGTSFPPRTNFPAVRLDYIFARNNVQPVRSEIMKTVVSDHYPVYAEILIPAR